MLMGTTHAFGSTAFIELVLKLPMYSPLVLESSHHIANSARDGERSGVGWQYILAPHESRGRGRLSAGQSKRIQMGRAPSRVTVLDPVLSIAVSICVISSVVIWCPSSKHSSRSCGRAGCWSGTNRRGSTSA